VPSIQRPINWCYSSICRRNVDVP